MSEAPARCRLGVDVGGTFTDLLLVDQASGAMRIAKVPSTPADQSEGFMAASPRSARRRKGSRSSSTAPRLAPTPCWSARGCAAR